MQEALGALIRGEGFTFRRAFAIVPIGIVRAYGDDHVFVIDREGNVGKLVDDLFVPVEVV